MRKTPLLFLLSLVLTGCLYAVPTAQPQNPQEPAFTAASPTVTPFEPTGTPTSLPPTATPVATQGSSSFSIPDFDHIVLIVLENEYLQNVIQNTNMPNFALLAKQNVLLTNYAPITHPSLPNYLAMISGSTQEITSDCTDCFIAGPNLADEIESSGRTWKAYFEDMPSPCFIGSKKPYSQIFNPFVYFDSIRLNAVRCEASLVPLTQLDQDLQSNQLPNFMYIAPNVCHSGHDCPSEAVDQWLGAMVAKLQTSAALKHNSLIIVTFDEGVQPVVPILTHGEVATLLISPLARSGFEDTTSYSHYSLLKTILLAWNLPALGETQQPATNAIMDPWVDQIGLIYPNELTVTP